MNSREQQLLKLNFKKNEHQQTYNTLKYDRQYYVNFWEIEELDDYEWNSLIENLIRGFKTSKKQYFEGLRQSPGYELAQKKRKKKLLDKYNYINSQLSEEKNRKLTKTLNLEKIKELEIKVKLIKEIINGK